MVLVAHISDTHLLADPTLSLWGRNTDRNLAAVMDALPTRSDVLVVTGDIAEDGAPEAYRRALSLTEGRAGRRYFLPGNHDDPDAMRAVPGATEPLRLVQLTDSWTMALLNSRWAGHESGHISDETLARLRDRLAGLRTHVALCLHHPPVSPCANSICGMDDARPIQEIIESSPVRVVLSGHVHQQFDTTRGTTRFLGAPSTFRQLRHGGDPHHTDTNEPPAAQLIELLDDGQVTCEVIRAAEQ